MTLTDARIESILETLPHLYPDLAPGTLRQADRWGRDLLAWCAAERARPTAADPTLLLRYEAAHPARFGVSRAAVRTQLRKVLAAADAVLPRPRGSGGRFTARRREIPERSRLGGALRDVEAGARNAAHRRQLSTLLGRFLLWCDERGIRPEDCVEADLVAYRRYLQRQAATSTGADVDAAKRLLLVLGVLDSHG